MGKREEKVLLYQFLDEERLQAARDVLRRLGIASEALPASCWAQKIGFLLGLKGYSAASEPEDKKAFIFSHEVIILYNIQNRRLDQVLGALSTAIGRMRYKAVVTPMNRLWSLRRLCETMQKEHAFMAEKISDTEKFRSE